MIRESEHSELIDDHEVESSEQDTLGHQNIADQLLDLIRDVRTPTNVALYGPWGSGKTGIANLVRSAIHNNREQYKGFRFVRFDAFKFAETPLRRNFLSAVATELQVKDPRYHDDLYTGVTSTKYSIPATDLIKVMKIFFAVLAAVCIVLAGLAAILAAFQQGGWSANFTKDSRWFLVAGFPFAALLTAVFALAAKAFGREHRTDKAEGPEQFEALFRQLVEASKAERLVVFVDEVDRCSPTEVVATLDVIRTFLGVDRCVFIVAADQQVLEAALSREVRQATPSDDTNPYYSTGSAYLDKVFQYQVTVPPLLNQRVTRYAAGLVANREGIWAGDARETIISVLIPSHVRSPRRVKHLLNAFVLAHRVAVARHATGLLDSWTESRSIELAKLVCLQVEFPLFARSLIEVPQLVDYVHAGRTDPQRWEDNFPLLTPRARKLTDEYLHSDRPVASNISPGEDSRTEDEPGPMDVEAAQGEQLFDYLSRTSSIHGPQRDLIYLQGIGSPFGLPSDVADRVIEAAQNGQIVSVQKEMTEETAEAVFDLVTNELRTALGVEQRNVTLVLLALLSDDRVELPSRADTAITTISPALTASHALLDNASVARGIWSLTSHSSLDEARRLEQLVIGSKPVRADVGLAVWLLSDTKRVLALSANIADDLIGETLISAEVGRFVQALQSLPSSSISALLEAAPSLTTRLSSLWIRADEASVRIEADEQAASANAKLQPYQQVPFTPTAHSDDAQVVAQSKLTRQAIEDWLDKLSALEDKEGIQSLISALLATDRVEARNLVEAKLESSGEWTNTNSVDLLLNSMSRRPVSLAPNWLRAINTDVATQELLVDRLVDLSGKLLDVSTSDDTASVVASDLGSVVRKCNKDVQIDVYSGVIALLPPAVDDDDQATARISTLRRAALLVDSGVLSAESLQNSEDTVLADTIAAEFDDTVGADSPFVQYVSESMAYLLNSWGSGGKLPLSNNLYEATETSPWLPSLASLRLRLMVQARFGRIEDSPSLDDLVSAAVDAETRKDGIDLVLLWLAARRVDMSSALVLIETLRRLNAWLNVDVLQALRRSVASMAYSDRRELIASALAAHPLPGAMVTALGFADLRGPDALNVVVERANAAANNADRKYVVGSLGSKLRLPSGSERGRYIDEVLVPMFSAGYQASLIALEGLEALGRPFPNSMREPLRRAVRLAVSDNDKLEGRASTVLQALGFRMKRKGVLGLGGTAVDLE